ncbi:MAG: hypothetical protein AABY55_00635 [Candidatus Omnitrophota bacterium]
MTEYMKSKYSARTKLRWQDPEFQKKMKEALSQRPNALENDFYNKVIEKIPNLVYVGCFDFFVNGKNPDFILDENGNTSKCIDLFGDYWHKDENPQERVRHFKDAGYNLLVIWEHEWKNHQNMVISNVVKWASSE